ncbi:hypothetical protein VNO77_02532 [Canavalia gladiata]|uniref:Uncharacterized protein n=1 Tax=Canavalia gladiata TaxID=3824 RepID=A0AAN9R349_CANGL
MVKSKEDLSLDSGALTSNWNSLYFLKKISGLKELFLDFSGLTLLTLISSKISWLGLHFCALEFVSTSLEFRYVPLYLVSLGDDFESCLRQVQLYVLEVQTLLSKRVSFSNPKSDSRAVNSICREIHLRDPGKFKAWIENSRLNQSRGSGFVVADIPFTPRAKRVLELSLEETR